MSRASKLPLPAALVAFMFRGRCTFSSGKRQQVQERAC